MNLFPIPTEVIRIGGWHDYSARSFVTLPPGVEFRLKAAAIGMARSLSACTASGVEVSAGKIAAEKVLARLEPDSAIPAQGYRLETTAEGFRIAASEECGWYYGLLTLEQLVRAGLGRVPGLRIDDAPDFKFRGYMLDVSRCKVPTMATVKALIDQLSRLRYNELQLYMEHTFAFGADERVWFDNSPFTPEEILELDDYSRSRFVELVPNLNSFGHLERWLRLPEYRELAESETPWYFADWDAHCQAVLAPGEKALQFIDRLYAEFLPNFTSSRLNIGCDETLELGRGKSASLCEQKGTTRVYLDFVADLTRLAARHGRQVQFWGDIILHQPELIAELPPGVTALEWGYEADHPFAEDAAKFHAAGVPFYVCPGTSSWNSISGRTKNMLGNLANAARNGHACGAIGLLLTDWGDGGHQHYWPMSWLGLSYAAACAWNSGADNEAVIAAGIALSFCPEAQTPRLTELLMELGRIPECFAQKQHNCTAYFLALLRSDWLLTERLIGETTEEEVRQALQRLQRWRKSFRHAPPEVPRLVLDELTNTADLTELALRKLAFACGAKISIAAKRRWNDLMRHVIGRHSALWLARNRPGGLHESSETLRKTLFETE